MDVQFADGRIGIAEDTAFTTSNPPWANDLATYEVSQFVDTTLGGTHKYFNCVLDYDSINHHPKAFQSFETAEPIEAIDNHEIGTNSHSDSSEINSNKVSKGCSDIDCNNQPEDENQLNLSSNESAEKSNLHSTNDNISKFIWVNTKNSTHDDHPYLMQDNKSDHLDRSPSDLVNQLVEILQQPTTEILDALGIENHSQPLLLDDDIRSIHHNLSDNSNDIFVYENVDQGMYVHNSYVFETESAAKQEEAAYDYDFA